MEASITAWVAALVALIGAAGTLWKARGESRQLAVAAAGDVVEILREEVQRQQTQLDRERQKRVDERQQSQQEILRLNEHIEELERRVQKLELWIMDNTTQDPFNLPNTDG